MKRQKLKRIVNFFEVSPYEEGWLSRPGCVPLPLVVVFHGCYTCRLSKLFADPQSGSRYKCPSSVTEYIFCLPITTHLPLTSFHFMILLVFLVRILMPGFLFRPIWGKQSKEIYRNIDPLRQLFNFCWGFEGFLKILHKKFPNGFFDNVISISMWFLLS